MTRYEKWALLLLLLMLVLQLSGTAYPSLVSSLGLGTLALSYLVGGYRLFNSSPLKPIIKVVAGVGLAAAIISFYWTSSVNFTALSRMLPVINGAFCIGLGAFLVRHRRDGIGWSGLHGLWLRSAVWLVISAFFAYCPISFTPYRKILIALNQGYEFIASNLRMFDYTQEYDEAMARQDYTAAVGYGRQALEMGKKWLGPPSELQALLPKTGLTADDLISERWRISGAYTNLYSAYEKLGDNAYKQAHYQQALEAYLAGNNFLVAGDHRKSEKALPDAYWEEEKAWSLKNVALCYEKLQQFGKSDTLFLQAMQAYKRVHPAPDVYYARLVGYLAEAYAAQDFPAISNAMYRKINRLLVNDTTQDARHDLLANRLQITNNYLRQDSLIQALHELDALSFAPGDTSINQQNASLYRGICLYKLGKYEVADRVLRRPLRFFEARGERYWSTLSAVELMVAKNSLARGRYVEAKALATAALGWRERKLGRTSDGYATCLEVVAAVNKVMGNYALASQQLEQAINLLRQDKSGAANSLPEALTQFTDLEVTLGRLVAAETHIREALALAGKIDSPSQTGVLVTAAYVDYVGGNYKASQARYRLVIAINQRFGQAQSANIAAAWNGLGLLATSQNRLEKADSLFQQAISLHEALFTKRHPLTGGVYLNCGLLRIQQGRYGEAATLVQQSLAIARVYFPADHDVFGDIAMALGDLAKRQQQVAVAQQQYRQALTIYGQKFGAAHWKTRLAQQKLEGKRKA